VWVAESDDVPGLASEAETAEALIRKLEVITPELLEANGLGAPDPVPFQLLAERRGTTAGQYPEWRFEVRHPPSRVFG